MVFRFATVQNESIQWLLRRNCAMTPAQVGWFFLSLCGVSLGIAAMFWFQGVVWVLPFAFTELAALGLAFLVYARHATDGECISLRQGSLLVELERAGRTERAEFRSDWVRVEPSAGDRSLIEVSCQGRSVSVGRFVRPELRPMLAKEIRMALRMA